MQVCLGSFHVGTLATCSWLRNLQSWPLCAKFSHSLIEQNHSLQNWPKTWSLVHGPRLDCHREHYLDVLNPMELMVCKFDLWSSFYGMLKPPPTGFQGHLLNPYPGHRMETVHKKGLLVGHASVFRHVLCGNTGHTFMVKQYTNLTPMCKNFTFTYWAKP